MPSRPRIAALASTLIATACATTAPPPAKILVESRAAVRVAEQTGAQRDPGAAQYLALARQQIAEAERLMNQRDHASARRILEAAHVHAVMASELARHANARADATATRQEIEDLRARVPSPRS